ncbi:hypothetical protein [Achromobacter phage Motura]|uniref:Uncharacterized protein n=1 Tax=Achromobacter phage Motura TaxID=2591403 RepID=A0A514CSW7_9CAUD|nr:hypothetical protein H1O15_gp217 [Achromobacter phage Motura]QDH83571.1 hypothetical protein [Achromobacter phage Motura]
MSVAREIDQYWNAWTRRNRSRLQPTYRPEQFVFGAHPAVQAGLLTPTGVACAVAVIPEQELNAIVLP